MSGGGGGSSIWSTNVFPRDLGKPVALHLQFEVGAKIAVMRWPFWAKDGNVIWNQCPAGFRFHEPFFMRARLGHPDSDDATVREDLVIESRGIDHCTALSPP